MENFLKKVKSFLNPCKIKNSYKIISNIYKINFSFIDDALEKSIDNSKIFTFFFTLFFNNRFLLNEQEI